MNAILEQEVAEEKLETLNEMVDRIVAVSSQEQSLREIIERLNACAQKRAEWTS